MKIKNDEIIEIEEIIEEDNFLDLTTETENFVAEDVITHNSYQKPSKRSISCGYYMPSVIKEGIEVIVAVDTSGSIGEKELVDFVSEIIGLAKAFQERIHMTLITCDAKIQNTYEIANGNIEKIKNEVKMRGGGGTSFTPVIDWINENKRDAKLLIYLTDGYGDKIQRQKYDILWVLSHGGSDDLLKDVGNVIKLEKYENN